MTEQNVRILLAEDNEGDVFLVRRALEKQGLHHELMVARNGEDALEILERARNSPGFEPPQLILLDLNLPRVNGNQILSEIRNMGLFSSTPVIILTSSDSSKDRELALQLGADLYFHKPTDLNSFMQLGRVIEETLSQPRAKTLR